MIEQSAILERADYYVYLYLREDQTPYYVGMGRKYRAFVRHKRRNGKCVPIPESRERIIFVHEGLTQQQAFKKEIELIAHYGIKEDGGLLINLSYGGEGAKHSESVRKRLSEVHTGKQLSAETKKRISQAHKGRPRDPAAIKLGVATRRARNGYVFSEEHRAKLSESRIGVFAGAKNPAARAIEAFDRLGNLIGVYDTAREAAEVLDLGTCWKHIPSVCRGKRPHTKGYVFKYAEKSPNHCE